MAIPYPGKAKDSIIADKENRPIAVTREVYERISYLRRTAGLSRSQDAELQERERELLDIGDVNAGKIPRSTAALQQQGTQSNMNEHHLTQQEKPATVSTQSALDVQVAGSHYKNLKIQPVEYIHANKLGFCEGSVVKYITRWREKGGTKDLEKAKHFIDLLIELENKEADAGMNQIRG